MNNIQEATARALGYEVFDEPLEQFGHTWMGRESDGDLAEYLPDPSEPNVYEAVRMLAIKENGVGYVAALSIITGQRHHASRATEAFANEFADGQQIVRAALVALGLLDIDHSGGQDD